jgi:hypothetical protein
MNKFFGHLRTVIKHRHEVCKLCFKCGLYWQGITHDLSKFSPVEFFNGVKYYTGKGSPHLGERKENGYSKAWLHHKGHNKHHAEYWQDILPNGYTGCVSMPKKYFAEMLCDRIAASKIYLGDNYTKDAAWNYYNTHRDENQFTRDTRQDLVLFLQMLRDHGEDYMFEYLRTWLKI